jgi:hypothetical protein
MTRPALAIDLGTSTTVAVLRRADGAIEALPVGAPPAARGEVPLVERLAAVLRRARGRFVDTVGVEPSDVTLTHRAGAGAGRRSLLGEAASLAGLPAPRFVTEPAAAAAYAAGVLDHPLPDGAALVVYDLGAARFDAAVVRRDGDAWTVLAAGGRDDCAGLDLDAALVQHIAAWVREQSAAAAARLAAPETAADRRALRALAEELREVKEALSTRSIAYVRVRLDGMDGRLNLTRGELEGVARPLLERTVETTAAVVREAGLEPAELAGVLLVGGVSRIPLVAQLLHGRLGIVPTRAAQPEQAIAYGALHVPDRPAETAETAGPEVDPDDEPAPEPAELAEPAPAGEQTTEPAPPTPRPRRSVAVLRPVARMGGLARWIAVFVTVVALGAGLGVGATALNQAWTDRVVQR